MDYLSKSECKHRGLYRIRARNIYLGVYNAEKGEFYGIREKFGRFFIDGECHWDNDPPFATAKPTELLPDELPEDILVAETLPGLVCSACGKSLKAKHDGKYLYKHVDEVSCQAGKKVYGSYRSNDALFKWLETMEKKYPFALHSSPKE